MQESLPSQLEESSTRDHLREISKAISHALSIDFFQHVVIRVGPLCFTVRAQQVSYRHTAGSLGATTIASVPLRRRRGPPGSIRQHLRWV